MPQLEQLLKKYPEKVKLVFKSFPIRSHRFALKAAAAALAAQRQNKFWQFHDMLFENYNILNDQKIEEIAGKVGLDTVEFNRDRQDPAINAHIRQDYEDGIELGVRGTPTVFINGKRLRNRSMRAMETAIEEELQKQQKTSEKEEGK